VAKLQLETPRIETSQPLQLLGLEQNYNSKTRTEIPKQWTRFAPHIPALSGKKMGKAYGVVLAGSNPDSINYFCGVEASENVNASTDFTRVSIPAHRFAKFSHHDHVSKLHETEMEIMDNWVAEHCDQVARDQNVPVMVEYYGPGFNPQTGMGDIEVWIPVKN
jgi:AraC family transcriptional regulator